HEPDGGSSRKWTSIDHSSTIERTNSCFTGCRNRIMLPVLLFRWSPPVCCFICSCRLSSRSGNDRIAISYPPDYHAHHHLFLHHVWRHSKPQQHAGRCMQYFPSILSHCDDGKNSIWYSCMATYFVYPITYCHNLVNNTYRRKNIQNRNITLWEKGHHQRNDKVALQKILVSNIIQRKKTSLVKGGLNIL